MTGPIAPTAAPKGASGVAGSHRASKEGNRRKQRTYEKNRIWPGVKEIKAF